MFSVLTDRLVYRQQAKVLISLKLITGKERDSLTIMAEATGKLT